MNSSYNVMKSTLAVMKTEFVRGYELFQASRLLPSLSNSTTNKTSNSQQISTIYHSLAELAEERRRRRGGAVAGAG
jgi:hypothetical protein